MRDLGFKRVGAGIIGVATLSLLVACGPERGAGFETITPVTTSATAPVSQMEEEAQLISLINQERGKRGLPALHYNGTLALAAQRHTDDMIAKGYFAHKNLSRKTPGDRVRAAGYSYCFVAENLSMGYGTVQQSMLGWMESKGHRDNILSRKPTEIGVGVGSGGMRVAVFAKPC